MLREFKVGEKSKAETHATQTKQDIQLMSFVSNRPVPAIRRLPITKFEEGRAFLRGFMGRGPGTRRELRVALFRAGVSASDLADMTMTEWREWFDDLVRAARKVKRG